jgi:hypothetical protein
MLAQRSRQHAADREIVVDHEDALFPAVGKPLFAGRGRGFRIH